MLFTDLPLNPNILKGIAELGFETEEPEEDEAPPVDPIMLRPVDELELTKEHISIPYIVGENIKVVDGPFNGFTGSIENVNEEKRKLQVMVKIFG